MGFLYKNKTLQSFEYILRPVGIIIAVVCTTILQRSGVFAEKWGMFFLFIPIGLVLCVLGNIVMVSCIKKFNVKSNTISIDHVNGFKTTSYDIKKSDISMIVGEYKLKKYFFIESSTHHWSHTPNPAELFDFYFKIVLNSGKEIILKHNVEQFGILDIFEPLTNVVSNIQIDTPTNISRAIVQTGKLKSFSLLDGGVLWQFNGEK